MVLIIADTDNSLWKHQPFLQALCKIQTQQYSLENAVVVCMCGRACEYNIHFAAGGQSMHNNERR